MANEQRLLLLRLSQSNMNLALIHCTALAPLDGASPGEEMVRPSLDHTQAGTRGEWQPHDALTERGCDGVQQHDQAQPEMFLVAMKRFTPKIHKKDTWYRDSLEVGLKLAITHRYLARGVDGHKSLMYLLYGTFTMC